MEPAGEGQKRQQEEEEERKTREKVEEVKEEREVNSDKGRRRSSAAEREQQEGSDETEEEERETGEDNSGGRKKKMLFYMSTTEQETDETDIERGSAAPKAGDKGNSQRRQRRTTAESSSNGGDDSRRRKSEEGDGQQSESPPGSPNTNTTTDVSLSVANLMGTGQQKDKKAKAAQQQGRSVSEVLRQKLASLPLREEGNFTLGFSKVFHTRTRFLMMLLCLLCLASVWSNILCFNFALICMERPEATPEGESAVMEVALTEEEEEQQSALATAMDAHSLGNGTANNDSSLWSNSSSPSAFRGNGSLSASPANATAPADSPPSFTARQRLYLTSAVAAAALVANFAIVSLVNNYGIRTIFACLGFLSAVSTCLLPAALEMGFYYVLACRMLQGVAFSANFPVIGAFTSKWTYYKQNGLFVSALVAYVQFAPAVTMPVSGALCEFLGWPWVFYAHGGASSLLFCLWALFFRNSPNKHPFVGEVELRKIAVGKSELSKEMHKQIPVRQILSTASVWAVWIAAIGNFVCVNMMFLYTPSYLNKVLHFPVAHTGLSASLAPLAQFGIKLFAGFTSDKIRFLSETNKLRLYNSVAFFGSALALTMLAFFPVEFPTLCLGVLGLSAGLLGFTTGGFFKAGPLVAKHYALVVMGQISLAITITLLLVPIMQNTLAPQNKPEQWREVFLLTAAILVLTNLAFCLMCSAQPADWTSDDFSRSASKHKIHSMEALNQPRLGPPQSLG